MKKSISIHEVPEILQELIYNTAGRNLSKHSYALPYLNKLDWTKATNAERLAYCEVVYTGKEVICLVDGHRYDGLKLRTQYSKNEVWVNGEINGDAGWSVCLYKNGKFAEIIEDEAKEPSIKEKLKGTCVLNEKEGMGAEIVKLYTEAGFENRYKQIGSTPNSYYGENEGTILCWATEVVFEKRITLDQLRSIVRGEKEKPLFKIDYSTNCTAEEKLEIERMFMEAYNKSKNAPKVILNSSEGIARPISESVEFKEGEMVDVLTKGEWCKVEYAFFAVGKHWFYNVNFKEKDTVHIAEEIRKIDQDPHGFLKTANEIISERIQHKPFHEDSVRDMLIEAMKRVKK